MFGIGFTELLIILVIALLVVGPERLPALARQLGSFVREIRKMYDQVREQARAEIGPEFDEFERNLREIRSLDPRQQVRDFSRSMLDDLSADAPEIKQALNAPKVNLDQLGRSVLQDELLDQPLSESLRPTAESSPGSASVKEGGLVAPATPVAANGPAPSPSAPPVTSSSSPADTSAPQTVRHEVESTGHYE